MKLRAIVTAMIMAMLLTACSATGPVRFYQGPEKPRDQLAIVIVPAALTVKSIDGLPVDSPSKESGTYQLEMLPGHHLIEFRYELFWGTAETGMLVKSKYLGIDAVFNAGTTYSLHYKAPHSYDEATDILLHFSATMTNDQTGQTYASYEIENLGAVLATKGIGKNQAKPQPDTATVPVTTATTGSAAKPMTSRADEVVNQDPVKRLKFWWLMANKQQREEFSEWMKGANESFAPEDKNNQDDSPPGTINGVKLKP